MTELADSPARDRIATDTAATLFVEAGAGSGKTSALVRRITTLVLTDRIPLSAIAAVTFTEKAGAELRDRLRVEFEKALYDGGSEDLAVLATGALDDLDGASIGTLHSFAQQLLTMHPIEAGLPLLLAMAAGVELKHVRSLARLFGNEWDLIGDRVLVEEPAAVAMPDVAPLVDEAARIAEQLADCIDPSDKLLPKVVAIRDFGLRLGAARDDETRITELRGVRDLKFGLGRKTNWPDIERLRSDCLTLVARATELMDGVLDTCLRQLAVWVARRVLESAELRRAEGRLEFHDLLVLSRDLLRRDPAVRAALQQRYERLLLDEFQDTDPIQIELAVRIAGGAAAAQPDWQDVEVPPGRLFVVGDPKQSIYRFRRADIAMYLSAQDRLGETVALTTNFRTVPAVLDWVNAVFGNLIQRVDGAQPSYQPLGPHRDTAAGPAVTVLGAVAHDDLPRAQASVLRE